MSGGSLKVPLVMRAPVGVTGRGSQHAQNMETFFMPLPGIKLVCPATAYDALYADDHWTAHTNHYTSAMMRSYEEKPEALVNSRVRYNRARQAKITKELIEIVSGAAALD